MNQQLQITLLAMVLELCKGYGMTANDINNLFNKKTINGGMKILEAKK